MMNSLAYQPTDLRFERKFLVEGMNYSELLSLIEFHPQEFFEIYPERQINNIYFDTLDYRFFASNLVGVGRHRPKIRVRWYGKSFGACPTPTLEIKLREGLLNQKLLYSLNSFDFEGQLREPFFQKGSGVVDWPSSLEFELKFLKPVIFNSYRRQYFSSRDGNYRVTLDREMEYRAFGVNYDLCSQRHEIQNQYVLELKYSNESNLRPDLVSARFPFRLSRNSKYVTGVTFALGLSAQAI